jgi:hypothetical protein
VYLDRHARIHRAAYPVLHANVYPVEFQLCFNTKNHVSTDGAYLRMQHTDRAESTIAIRLSNRGAPLVGDCHLMSLE